MQLHWIKPLIGIPGPFVTVYLDATRGDESGYREVMNRWQGLKRSLVAQSAPSDLIELLEDRISEPTHAPGKVGRFLIVGDGRILVDRVLKTPPREGEAVYAGAPALRAAAAASDDHVNYFLLEVNRLGATVRAPDPRNPVSMPELYAEISGDHDVVHKVRGGGFHHGRLQNRAEDSWERNADHTATRVDELVATDRPELLLLGGDVRALGLVKERLGDAARKIAVDLPGGAWQEGAPQSQLQGHLDAALSEFRARRRAEVIDRFEQEHGRDGAAVVGRDAVLAALRRG
ncbi:MAG TPA: Vms1/Ankzf1 family peptidyl-tRNA hydrolase, partial [Actinomycetales bacterium]|nr:Vms1/Ankzf1 family peptidyl-tRNA hydrolase [Actinomycetales bacterium]